MQHRIYTIASLLLVALSPLSAQRFQVNFGITAGASQLFHGTQFDATPLVSLYKIVQQSHKPPESYTWERFEKDYQLRTTFIEPRFGINLYLNYDKLPFFALLEANTSTSSFRKPSYAATLGFGRDFTLDSVYFFSGHVGLKHIFHDAGFGSNTIVNSIGNNIAREEASKIFDPRLALGRNSGNVATLRVGVGRFFGYYNEYALGLEAYGELDLTDKIVRDARMNAIGINAYMRYRLFSIHRGRKAWGGR
jgi:hypothetical protein